MAKTSMKVKQQRPQKFSTREYTRCKICGRPHSVLRKYGIEVKEDQNGSAAGDDKIAEGF